MKELEKFFNDIGRIADALENRKVTISENTVDTVNTVNTVVNEVVKEASLNVNSQEQINTSQVTQQPIPTTIPIADVQPTYTQEQLAVAMGRAIDMGKMVDIQNLLAQFKVACLAELDSSNYNDLALKLREIGVDV